MELIKLGQREYQLHIDGIFHVLDLKGINACCYDTNAIYAGLKYITDDPQYFSFFANCFGHPHAFTYFPDNKDANANYDIETHKLKIYSQARLLQGKIREYFLEAVLKHCLWINDIDIYTNSRFEFEKVLMPDLKLMLLEWDKRTSAIQDNTLKLQLEKEEEGENDIIRSTIDDFLFEFKEERILIEIDYNQLVLALHYYFKNGVFPEKNETIKVARVNIKRFGWALNEIFKALKTNNENLSSDYLEFAHQNISIFKDVQFDLNDVLSSNLYKYFTTKT